MIVPGVDGDIIPVLPDIIYRVRRESPTEQDLELPPLSSDGPHPLISGERSSMKLVEYIVMVGGHTAIYCQVQSPCN